MSLDLGLFASFGAVVVVYLRRRSSQWKDFATDASTDDEGSFSTLDAVGGHGSKRGKGEPILVRGEVILKPFQPAQAGRNDCRGELEANFYKYVFSQNHSMREFVPKFHGIETVHDTHYLVLDNVVYNMAKPCMLDLKMGQQTYDEEASASKIAREKKKYPPQEVIGFRIVGMKVYRQHAVYRPSRDWCMSITPPAMHKAIEQFFFDGKKIRYDLMKELINKINKIQVSLRNNATWRMYGSSLLVAYDAEKGVEDLHLKMIDFAHVYRIADGGVDDGYLHGLKFLKGCLETSLSNRLEASQIGGHGNVSQSSQGKGQVLKIEDKPEQFDTEVEFYKRVINERDSMGLFMPMFFGVNLDVKPREMILEDVTLRVATMDEDVSIMDVKLGVRSHRSDAPNTPEQSYFKKYASFVLTLIPSRASYVWTTVEGVGKSSGPDCLKDGLLGKRDYLRFRDATTTTSRHGYRLTGLRHGDYSVSVNEARSIENQSMFQEKVEHFLWSHTGFQLEVALRFRKQLDEVLAAYESSPIAKQYEMIGSSLLFMHSGSRACIRWIDFANSINNPTTDHNGIDKGLTNLKAVFDTLIQKHCN